MLKNLALLLGLALSPITAKWEGVYLRGKTSIVSINGTGEINSSFASGYGVILPGYFNQGLYVGLDAELLNINISLASNSDWNFRPKALLRIGIPQTQYLPYLALSLAYYGDEPKGLFTWGLRAGIDFDFISPSFFWGPYIDYSKTINAPSNNFYILTSGISFGCRF